MNQIVLIIPLLCHVTSAAFATTGWDRHDMQVATFRIHGANGASFVHRIAANGVQLEPALCSNVDATDVSIGPALPPDYAVTGTHVAIRYPIVDAENMPPNHFLIRIEDGQVTGPLTEMEFSALPLVSEAELRWKMPLMASDRFNHSISVLTTCVSLLLLTITVAVVRWVSSRLLRATRTGVIN